jgi:hypothetical protein
MRPQQAAHRTVQGPIVRVVCHRLYFRHRNFSDPRRQGIPIVKPDLTRWHHPAAFFISTESPA